MRTVVFLCVLALLFVSPAFADGAAKKKKGKRADDRQVLEDLERGVRALRSLGRHEEAEHLLEILRDVAEGMKAREDRTETANRDEWKAWTQRTKVMKRAVVALMEAERGHEADRLEHGIHAIELALEGRNDAEAKEIRKTAPKLAEMLELIGLGAELWADFGHEEESARLTALVRKLRGADNERAEKTAQKKAAKAKKKKTKAKKKVGKQAKAATLNQLEVYHLGMKAMAEAERPREHDVMERAARATEVTLKGRKDKEARAIQKDMPEREAIVEVLRYAGRLYAEWGHEDRADICMRAADKFMQDGAATQVKVKRRKIGRDDAEVRELEERLESLQDQIRRLANELEELKRAVR